MTQSDSTAPTDPRPGADGGAGGGARIVVGPGKRVTLHFSLLLDDGTEIDSTRRGKPATFIVGDGNLLQGFEEALFGLGRGDDEQLRIPPEKAFGEPNAENLQRFPVSQFGDAVLEPGLVVSFRDAANSELFGIVQVVEGDEVVVDFNHPLAGRTVTFDVSVLRVEDYLIT